MSKNTSFTVALIGSEGVGKSTVASYFSLNNSLSDVVGIYEIQINRITISNGWNEEFDVCVLVACGDADQSYKQIYDILKSNCRHIIIAVNKIDILRDNGVSLIDIENRWRSLIGLHSDVVLISAKYGKNMEQLQVIIADVVRNPSAFPLPSTVAKKWWLIPSPTTVRQSVVRGFFTVALVSSLFFLFNKFRR